MSTDHVDLHVGDRIRRRRREAGISQATLAEGCGVTFQQIQKYENGTNRISASMMFRASRVLGVEPGYFFEGLDVEPIQIEPETMDAMRWLDSAEALPLAKAVVRLPPPMKDAVLRVARGLEGVPA